jgi:hypothetical protein
MQEQDIMVSLHNIVAHILKQNWLCKLFHMCFKVMLRYSTILKEQKKSDFNDI